MTIVTPDHRSVIKWQLRHVMADRRITNRDLAKALDMHEGSVSRMKAADEMPRIDGKTLDRLCTALECDLSDLIQRIPSAVPDHQGVA